MKVGNHNYFLSWREPWHKFEDWDWFNGRNFCRDRCMDLVSFDTKGEFEMFAEIMKRDNVTSVYTSGRKCNFQNKGCHAPGEAFWSSTGEKGERQPDNFEGIKHGPINAENNIGITIEGLQEFHDEACLATLNNKYNDGIAWHDVACHFRSVIICEDSDQLIRLVATQDGVDVRNEIEIGTNAIDVDALPQLPISAPLPPVAPPVVQQPPVPVQVQQTQFNNAGQFNGNPPPQFQNGIPRPPRPTRPTNIF